MMERLGRFLKFFEEAEQLRLWLEKEEADGATETRHRQRLETDLRRWQNHLFAEFGFAYEARLASDLSARIRGRTPAVIGERLQELSASFQESALKRFVCVLDAAANDYVDQEAIPTMVGVGFGDPADSSFPSAVPEIREAHLCLALSRHTACVIHLMRTVEYGLRELAMCSGVINPKVALEFQQWNQLIEQVESNYKTATKQWPRGAEKSAAQAFFGATVSASYGFKDDVRNIVMHARTGGVYDEQGALSVLGQVETFMQRLAGKLSENSGINLLTPACWP